MEFLHALRTDVSDATRQAVFGVLATHGRQWDRRYPFGDPVSADAGHVALLASRDYVVADKSDGVRACCVLASSITAAGTTAFHSVLIDRRGVLHGISLSSDAAFFTQGTVLDGELVQHARDGSWMYVVFDVAVLAGQKLECTLLQRLDACRTHWLETTHARTLTFLVKPMFALRGGIAAFQAHLDALPYRTDGMILTPNTDAPAPAGTCEDIIKLKTCHTMDFQWRDGMLWFGDDRELFPVTRLGLRFDPAQLACIANGAVVEMSPALDKADPSAAVFLHLLQVRQDKLSPNAYATITRTLRSVHDNITLDSILARL